MGQVQSLQPVLGIHRGRTYRRNSDVDVQNHRNKSIAAAQHRERGLQKRLQRTQRMILEQQQTVLRKQFWKELRYDNGAHEHVVQARRTRQWVKDQNELHRQKKLMDNEDERLGLRKIGPWEKVENRRIGKENKAMDEVDVRLGLNNKAVMDSTERSKRQQLGVVTRI